MNQHYCLAAGLRPHPLGELIALPRLLGWIYGEEGRGKGKKKRGKEWGWKERGKEKDGEIDPTVISKCRRLWSNWAEMSAQY